MAKEKQYPSETYPDLRGGDPEILRRYYGALDEYRQALAAGVPLPVEYLVAKLTTDGEVLLSDHVAALRQVEQERQLFEEVGSVDEEAVAAAEEALANPAPVAEDQPEPEPVVEPVAEEAAEEGEEG